MKRVSPKSCLLLWFVPDFWPPGGASLGPLGAILQAGTKQTAKRNFIQSHFETLSSTTLVKTSDSSSVVACLFFVFIFRVHDGGDFVDLSTDVPKLKM